MKKFFESIKNFWKKGKWQKFIVVCIAFLIAGLVGRITGITYVKIDNIQLDDINTKVGSEAKIKYTISPDTYDVKIVSTKYEIDDEKIAKINENKIIGLSEGETTIKVIIKDDRDNTIESNKAKITVELNAEQQKAKAAAELEQKRNTISTTEATMIKNYCEDIVKSILKSPSTAEFPGSFLNPFEGWGMNKKNNLVTVSSYVDAQNSFGATIRSEFVIQIQMNDDGSGKSTYVQFDGEVVSGTYQ